MRRASGNGVNLAIASGVLLAGISAAVVAVAWVSFEASDRADADRRAAEAARAVDRVLSAASAVAELPPESFEPVEDWQGPEARQAAKNAVSRRKLGTLQIERAAQAGDLWRIEGRAASTRLVVTVRELPARGGGSSRWQVERLDVR